MKQKINSVKSKVRKTHDLVKDKLPEVNLKRVESVLTATVVGNLTAAVPCLLKDLPGVAKSLAARSGDISPDKLFSQKIPRGVRLAKGSIEEFLKTHEVSHIISIKNAPEKAGDINNVIFEAAAKNRARGSENMTRAELWRVRGSNTLTGIKYGFKTTVSSAVKGAVFGALLELPITTLENTLHVRNNRKSVKDASADVAKDLGISAGSAGVAAIAFTGLGMIGVTLGPVAIPFAIIGGVVYTGSAVDRIWKALDTKTQKKLMNSDPVLFLTSVAHHEQNKNDLPLLKMFSK